MNISHSLVFTVWWRKLCILCSVSVILILFKYEFFIFNLTFGIAVQLFRLCCHAKEQKLAAYKNWIHRLLTLPLNENNKKKELNTIINIELNTVHSKEDILCIYNKLKQRQNNLENKAEKEQKWVTFTYTGNYIQKITTLFKDTNLKTAFKTTSTIGKLLNEKQETNSYEQSGIYKITCQSCYKVYIG
jgi:hypothetical protein